MNETPNKLQQLFRIIHNIIILRHIVMIINVMYDVV